LGKKCDLDLDLFLPPYWGQSKTWTWTRAWNSSLIGKKVRPGPGPRTSDLGSRISDLGSRISDLGSGSGSPPLLGKKCYLDLDLDLLPYWEKSMT
jgi:hypothetical protein